MFSSCVSPTYTRLYVCATHTMRPLKLGLISEVCVKTEKQMLVNNWLIAFKSIAINSIYYIKKFKRHFWGHFLTFVIPYEGISKHDIPTQSSKSAHLLRQWLRFAFIYFCVYNSPTLLTKVSSHLFFLLAALYF